MTVLPVTFTVPVTFAAGITNSSTTPTSFAGAVTVGGPETVASTLTVGGALVVSSTTSVSTFAGPVTLGGSQTIDTIVAVIKAASGQTADLTQWLNGAGVQKLKVGPDANLGVLTNAAAGHWQIGDLTLDWGTTVQNVANGSSSTAVNFASGFPTVAYIVLVSPSGTYGQSATTFVDGKGDIGTTNSFTVRMFNTGGTVNGVTFQWLAIGH